MSLPPAAQQQIEFAQGYIELGMIAAADEALDALPMDSRDDPAALAVRLDVHCAAARWSQAVETARRLLVLQPDHVDWALRLADATEKAESLEAALQVLLGLRDRFPKDGRVPFNISRCLARLGRKEEAGVWLHQAFCVDLDFLRQAYEDPLMAGVHMPLPLCLQRKPRNPNPA